MRIHTIVAAAVTVVILSLSAPTDAATVWTGCKDLATGALSKAKIGTKPSSACDVVKQIQVTYTKPFKPRKGPLRSTREWKVALDANEDELRLGPAFAIICFMKNGISTVWMIFNGKRVFEHVQDVDDRLNNRLFSYRRPAGFNSIDLGDGFLVSADGWISVSAQGCQGEGTATFITR